MCWVLLANIISNLFSGYEYLGEGSECFDFVDQFDYDQLHGTLPRSLCP